MGGSYNCNYFYYKYFFGYKSERDDISNACTGNRILTSLKIMEVIITRKKLSELAEGFTVYPQVLTNVRVTDKKAAQDDVDVQAAVKKVTEELSAGSWSASPEQSRWYTLWWKRKVMDSSYKI